MSFRQIGNEDIIDHLFFSICTRYVEHNISEKSMVDYTSNPTDIVIF